MNSNSATLVKAVLLLVFGTCLFYWPFADLDDITNYAKAIEMNTILAIIIIFVAVVLGLNFLLGRRSLNRLEQLLTQDPSEMKWEDIKGVLPKIQSFCKKTLLGGLLWGMSSDRRTQLQIRILMWTGHTYVSHDKLGHLDEILQAVKGKDHVDPLELAWFEANYACHRGDGSKAQEILEKQPPSLRNDQLLVKLYATSGDFNKVESRIGKHGHDDAVSLLKSLPVTIERNRILLKLWAKHRAWEQIVKFVESIKGGMAVTLLEELPQTPERDKVLVPLLYQNGKSKQILEIVGSYGVDQGVVKLQALLPAGPDCDQLVASFLARHGQYNQIRVLIASLSTQKAVHLLTKLTPNAERDLLLIEVWVKAGDVDAVLNFFANLSPERGIEMLHEMEAGVVRDRILARFYEQTEQHDQVVVCLEKYYNRDQLPASEIRYLARSYGELGHHEKALQTFEKAWDLDSADEDALNELCQKCMSIDKPSSLLSELGEDAFNKLKADALWCLVQHYNHFRNTGMAKKAAEVAVSLWKDQRVALFLGRVLEEEGKLREAAKAYAVAGKEGILPQGICLFRLEDFSSAITIFREISENKDIGKTVSYHLGYAFYRKGQLEEAVEAFQKADASCQDPMLQRDIAVLYGKLGKAAIDRQDFKKALSCFERGLRHAPPVAEQEIAQLKEAIAVCSYNLALSYVLATDGSEAIQFIDKAKEYRPGPWQKLGFLRGLNLLKEQKTEKAMQAFSVLCKRFQENRQFLLHKALAFSMGQHNDYAKNILNTIVADESNDSYGRRAQLLLGSIELREGNWAAAEEHLRAVNERP
jgi:tetratricopeptide (TPR) repeat protein